MMKEIKLKYNSKEEAKKDLTDKGIIGKEGEFLDGTLAVVWIGTIVLAQATFDEQGNELTPAVIADGYHVDLLLSDEITVAFASEIFPKNRRYSFQGINEEVNLDE